MLPDAIAGVWTFPETSKRPPRQAGRFLSLIEQSSASQRPSFRTQAWGTSAQDGLAHVALDARIEHKPALAARLQAPADSGDAELLLRCWTRWGLDAWNEVEGEFAAAIWDKQSRQLILARDPTSSRPLYLRWVDGTLFFSSTAASLACIGGKAEPDLEKLAYFLAFITDFGPRTFLSGVERVLPGCALIVGSRGEVRQHRWWKPSLLAVPRTHEQAIAEARQVIDRAVEAALESDRPVVAAHLSGGHDSSMVVEAASRLLDPNKSLVAITGTHAGDRGELPESYFDDADIAVQTAAMLPRVRHLVVPTRAEAPLDAVDRWQATDHCVLSPHNLGWLERTYEAARDAGAHALLVGASGNLTVSYSGHDILPQLAMRLRWGRMLREVQHYRRKFGGSWPGMLATAFRPCIPTPLWLRMAKWRGRQVRTVDEQAFLNGKNPRVRRALAYARKHKLRYTDAPGRVLGSKLRYRELRWLDVGSFNHFIRARFGVDVRDPLGSRSVMEFTFSLEPHHFFYDGEGRRLSKNLLRGRVPAVVSDQTIQGGMQGANWQAGAAAGLADMKHELELMAQDPELSTLFQIDRVRWHLDNWPSSGWTDPRQESFYRGSVTVAVTAGRFVRRVRERDCTSILQ
jgi:asparagine synthase (glutamine-hydrolysing)